MMKQHGDPVALASSLLKRKTSPTGSWELWAVEYKEDTDHTGGIYAEAHLNGEYVDDTSFTSLDAADLWFNAFIEEYDEHFSSCE